MSVTVRAILAVVLLAAIPTLAAAAAPTRGVPPINPLSILDSAGRGIDALGGGLLGGSDELAAAGGSDEGEGGEAGGGLSAAMNILIVLTVISIAPSIMLMATCFVRIIVVLGLLRQAMGVQQLPPAQVITGLALFMTLMVMSPTLKRVHTEAIEPYRTGEIRDLQTLWERASDPFRDFMFAQIEATGNWSSLYMVMEQRGYDTSEEALARVSFDDIDTATLVPAYMLSELKTAFLMGFRVYLPFLVIDIVIASLLISMSMMMLPPVLISLPFKLLLFVLVDGWTLVVASLIGSFVADPGAVALAPQLQPLAAALAGALA